MRSSQSALGAYFRRLSSRKDKPKAVTATAHKLARLIYAILTKGQEYTDQGQDYYEERYRQRVLHNVNRRAQQLGMTLVPTVSVGLPAQKCLLKTVTCEEFLERPHTPAHFFART